MPKQRITLEVETIKLTLGITEEETSHQSISASKKLVKCLDETRLSTKLVLILVSLAVLATAITLKL